MAAEKTEKTAQSISAPTDTEQSLQNPYMDSITDNDDFVNIFEENQKKILQAMDPSYMETVTMQELYETVYTSKPPLIENLLYPGTYLFAGAPKVGKSFFMAELAYHVSTGTPLWNYAVRKGTVLYLALEDDYRRLQKRLYRMFGTEISENLHFAVAANQIGNGLDKQIAGFMSEHPDTNLIIIDTLQKIRESGGDNYSYASDYEIITTLKNMASEYGVCLLLVHHTRKQASDDKFDMISGTNGLLGSADGAFVLQKDRRTSTVATLEISGRDQPDQRLLLKRNAKTLAWDLEGVEVEPWREPPEPLLEKISRFITEEHPRWDGTPTELADILQTDLKPNVLSLRLNVNAGRMFNDYRIRYENIRHHSGRKITLTFCPQNQA